MVIPTVSERPFLFVGERLCIDFVNTEPVAAGGRRDLLGGFEDLLEWSAQAGVIPAAEARDAGRRWRTHAGAGDVHRRAVELRAALRALLERLAAGRPAPPAALDAINDLLRLDRAERQVVRRRNGYATVRRRAFAEPIELLIPIAESAAELLAGDDLSLVKACQHPECVLFFYDTTKNHARRWCSMAACGNRAKVAAHYRRARAGADR